jgi:hypothetical protein
MLFDTSIGFAISIVSQKANLINPNIGEHECAVAAFAFNPTFL